MRDDDASTQGDNAIERIDVCVFEPTTFRCLFAIMAQAQFAVDENDIGLDTDVASLEGVEERTRAKVVIVGLEARVAFRTALLRDSWRAGARQTQADGDSAPEHGFNGRFDTC